MQFRGVPRLLTACSARSGTTAVKGGRVLRVSAALICLSMYGMNPVQAEGDCPSGMYPTGGEGVRGCAPFQVDLRVVAARLKSPPTLRPGIG